MRHLLISDSQHRKDFDIISIIKDAFPKEHLVIGTTAGQLFCKLCYGSCDVVRWRTEGTQEEFDEDLDAILKKYEGNELVYLPMEEFTTDFFIEYITKHSPKGITSLLPSIDLYRQFRNKESLNRYCLANGFSAPMLYETDGLDGAQYPVILKPVIGSGSHGIMRLMKAVDLTDEVKEKLKAERYVAQELIPNGKDVHGAFFLCKEGKVIGAYTHQRIRTSPEEGGVTVLSKMCYEEELINEGAKLLEAVKWDGLVMLEYLWDERTKKYKVIEANPRMWGSIMLSEYGGAYLLTNYVRLVLGMEPKQPEVNTERYIRWLFPMDLMNLLKRKFRMSGFWNMKNTCFINWSYARKDRALWFIFFSIFNKENLSKLFKRA